MTREPVAFKAFGHAKVVKADGLNFCLPAVRLMHPGVIEANITVAAPCGMATILQTDAGCTLSVQLEGMRLYVDGKPAPKTPVQLAAGMHLLLAFVQTLIGHDKEKSVRLLDPAGFKLINPIDPGQANPWCFIPLEQFNFIDTDLVHNFFIKEKPAIWAKVQGYVAETDKLLKQTHTPEEFAAALAGKSQVLSSEAMFVRDPTWQFVDRREMGDAAALVSAPSALMHETPAETIVQPSPDGDVELMYDLGQQDVGYYTFDLNAAAGTIVDIFGVEYITPDGRIQFARGNRNGMRYIAKDGVNRFTSLKRRSGRYIFVTLRHQQGPVAIRHLGLIESTYPVNAVGSFACSDARLQNIWEISTHTLKLCMEDTFTDCPLYEQTHWVGDARNESLFAYPVFGATDIGRRCIRITAESLDRYPFAGCQTPSGWDVLIPNWAFLWSISTWDYYWYTGDEAALRQMYPAVIRNLRGAEKYVDSNGLFAGPFWNFFDWTHIDSNQKAVLHNSMFMIGVIDTALKEADTLGDPTDVAWLRGLRQRMAAGVNKLWDPAKGAYPDSVRDDGTISPSICQHTSFLAIDYDIVDPGNLAAARKNLTDPPEKMTRIGSPFAALYLYQALEKLGLEDSIVQDIYKNYLPMLEAGATTVWESFPTGTTGGAGGWPTRSHCHAWSSAPSYYLNRIVLGIKPTAAGGRQVQISPRLSGLTWARGTVATAQGAVSVDWKLEDEGKTLVVQCVAPTGVKIDFVRNDSHAGKNIVFNGKKVD